MILYIIDNATDGHLGYFCPVQRKQIPKPSPFLAERHHSHIRQIQGENVHITPDIEWISSFLPQCGIDIHHFAESVWIVRILKTNKAEPVLEHFFSYGEKLVII